MSAEVHYLPPRCPACDHRMALIHVLADRRHAREPVRTFRRCDACGTGLIQQSQMALFLSDD
jgi:DNA-directed RNA polymerase subunit M/transcription elongation factor TFIIS